MSEPTITMIGTLARAFSVGTDNVVVEHIFHYTDEKRTVYALHLDVEDAVDEINLCRRGAEIGGSTYSFRMI